MSQTFRTATKFSGLQDYPNALSEVPAGSLQQADNVVVDKPGVVSPRRGQRVYAAGGGDDIDLDTPTRLFQLDADVYAAYTANGLPDEAAVLQRVVEGDTQPAPTDAPFDILPPPGNAMHSAEARDVAFISTADGIQKLCPDVDGVTSGTLRPAGAPYGLDLQATLSTPATGTLGFLAGGYSTAYRSVFGVTDPQGNVVLSAPSPAVQVENPEIEDALNLISSLRTGDATYMEVTLPYTPAASTFVNGYIVQGAVTRRCVLFSTSGSTTAVVYTLATGGDGGLYFFGAAGSLVSLVFPFTITAGGSPFTITGADARCFGVGKTVYAPFSEAAPGSIDSSAVLSTISVIGGATSITPTAGTWAAGSAAFVTSASISLAQGSNLSYLIASSPATAQVNDVIVLPSPAAPRTVLSSTVAVPALLQRIGLDAFPTGLDFTGTGQVLVNIERPKNVALTVTVPGEMVTLLATPGYSTFAQLYRSTVQIPISLEGTLINDNMGQAYQWTDNVGSTPTLSVTDIAPDATLGADLYTSPRQQGILAAKYMPPVASDMTLYENTLLMTDCYLPATYDTQLLGVSAVLDPTLAALQAGDIFTINGTAFTAIAVGPPAAGQFVISTGSGSATTDINQTVLNLSQAVNQAFLTAGNFGFVTLLSTAVPTSMGGTFNVRVSQGLGTLEIGFTAINGHPSPFSQLPTAAISPSRQNNALYFSQPGEPEAVPLTNFLQVGQKNTAIQRVLPLPGSCLVFKPEGIYQLVGTDPSSFSITILNTTAQLLANESAALLQSTVMAYTNQGVISVSPGGVQIVSLAINDTLRALDQLPAFASTAFGVAHEVERRYVLWTPTTESDTLPTQAFAYNVQTNTWARWVLPRTCGLADRNTQRLLTGSAAQAAQAGVPALYGSTLPGEAYQYGDETVTGEAYVIDLGGGPVVAMFGASTVANVDDIIANFPAGSTVTWPNGTARTVTRLSKTVGILILTLDDYSGLPTSGGTDATLYQGVECVFAPVPIAGDDPGTNKQFQELEVLFKNTDCPTISMTCATDFNQDETAIELVVGSLLSAGYGSGAWGQFQWGEGASAAPAQNVRQLISRRANRGHFFWPTISATVAANGFNVEGLTLAWTPTRTLKSR